MISDRPACESLLISDIFFYQGHKVEGQSSNLHLGNTQGEQRMPKRLKTDNPDKEDEHNMYGNRDSQDIPSTTKPDANARQTNTQTQTQAQAQTQTRSQAITKIQRSSGNTFCGTAGQPRGPTPSGDQKSDPSTQPVTRRNNKRGIRSRRAIEKRRENRTTKRREARRKKRVRARTPPPRENWQKRSSL